jgi:Cu/Ag efflux pump CusA
MMLAHYQHLVGAERQSWNAATALRGASERLQPIVMTALVTGLGLMPVAFAAERPGGEIDGAMSIVILGGLVTSTILNLLVFPTLALRFGRFAATPAP